MTAPPLNPKDAPSSSAPVECHSGYTYAERPTALYWEDQKCNIVAVLVRWQLPEGRRFRVRVEDGRIFDLYYTDLTDEWQIFAP